MSVRIESQSEPIPGYTLLERLGSGGFGEVWKCEAPGGIFKAVKIIFGDLRSQDNDLIRYAEQELKALKRVKAVRHPYLLALDRYDIVDGRLMIVMELAHCNLWDRFRECRDKGLPGIPRDELMLYMSETAEVLDLMNDQHGLQHLDIKPQNLFMLHNHVKVADFGQVKDLQGVMANVTGGITPVYAAPETFDGVVSRFCDQYSLACVYQELLTGTRPFDGCSMSQLLMQHLQLAPDLNPSPACDRPVLARALAKKADERWPNVSTFVRALRDASQVRSSEFGVRSSESGVRGEEPGRVSSSIPHSELRIPNLLDLDTPFPRAMAETDSHAPLFTPAPPEVSGPGPLRPALVVGLGQAGLRVIQRLRFDLTERFGSPGQTPLLRTLYVDTDADTLDDAAVTRAPERLAGLRADDVFAAKLHRAAHYLKPRLNGRSLTEGWFDTQLLYKIPRTPQTMGVRLLGRLAFCDHYRPLMAKFQAELDAAITADALHTTERRTGLQRRTNRPRVYVVAGLGGGTGGGMFLDAAYTLRAKLKRMGYESPEVIGVLLVPPADPSLSPQQALGNAYAALTELNHYSRSDTAFVANYDDRNGQFRDKDAPFTRCYLVPGCVTGLTPPRTTPPGSHAGIPAGRSPTPTSIPVPGSRPRMPGISGVMSKPGSRVLPASAQMRSPDPTSGLAALKPYADAAELLRLDLFAAVGRVADEERAEKLADAPGTGVRIAAFGLTAFDWPRSEVVTRTAEIATRTLLKRWLAPDLKRAREAVPAWAAARWTNLGLDPDALLAHLQTAADSALGGRVDDQIGASTEPLIPRGWLGRLPEPDRVAVVLDRLVKMFGPPASPQKRSHTLLEEALARTAADAAEGFAHDLRNVGPSLVEDPQFRFAGSEEMLRQFLATTDRLLDKYHQGASDADARAVAGYESLVQYTHFQKGMRKPNAAEFADALRQWPRARFQALSYRALASLYQSIRDVLAAQLGDVISCRQRMEEPAALADGTDEPFEYPFGPRRLLPPGCVGVADAVQRFMGVLADADLAEIDRRVQAALEPEFGGLFQACLNSTGGALGVVAALYEEARAYLDTRLGEVDLAAMFGERFRSQHAAQQAVGQAFAECEPAWVGAGPWCATEVVVVSAPPGTGGEPIRELARRAIPVAGLPLADSRDDMTVYREYPSVPLSVVPQLGPAAATAYESLPEVNQCSLHSRLDITRWQDVDKD